MYRQLITHTGIRVVHISVLGASLKNDRLLTYMTDFLINTRSRCYQIDKKHYYINLWK